VSGQSHRLPAPAGLLIDRARPLDFTFEGGAYQGYAGDSLASALAANGRLLLSRSFKYHRPRGPLSMAGLDANSYVQVGDEPNVPADRLDLAAGLAATAQNTTGSLEQDRDRWVESFGRFLPVGFYYRAFFKPRGVWKHWEKLIRAKAGLGKIDLRSPHDSYDKEYLFADVAVVGGGPAGLSAALEAAAAGCDVVLIDENERLGGSLLFTRLDGDPDRGPGLATDLAGQVADHGSIRVLERATCTGWFADNWLAVVRGRRLYKLRAGQVVLASGAAEQPMVFRNNDLPGVMLASAAQRLIRLYGVRPGSRAVVATANGDGYDAALDLAEAGVEVAAVVDLRAEPPPSPAAQAAQDRGLQVLPGHTVFEAIPGPGKKRVQGAVIDRIAGQGRVAGAGRRIDCDLIAMSVGTMPLGQLACHSGGRLSYDPERATFRLDVLPEGGHAAGAVHGAVDPEGALAGGRLAGWRAAKAAGREVGAEPPAPKPAVQINHPWPIFPHPKGKAFVDFDEDQTVADVENAVADGFEDIELVKRYTTVGMGPSQGRFSALNAVRISAQASGRALTGALVSTQRPPFKPESFGHLAGRAFEPLRLTAMHHRHLELGAQMMPAGAWLRPGYYGRPEDRESAILAEARAVRANVGLIDVSTLGGLEVRGPDAAELLERLYTFAYKKQPEARARYLLMTDQTGAIVDDGVACRLNAQHFYVTATTGGVDGVYRAMLRWNAEWRLEVDVANVTGAAAGVNIAGPNSRRVLETLDCDLDLSAAAFPYMGVRQAVLAGIPARLIRVGFVGELGYEIHVPASHGEALWDRLMAAGRSFDLRPFGVEAQRLLRLEKGHIIIGQDSDGLTTPQEADMAWALARKKPFFMGRRALEIQNARPLERKLVGFSLDAGAPVPAECTLVIRDGDIVGRVTSAASSPACGRVIGLAYVHPDDAEPGRGIQIKLEDGALLEAKVESLPFYDPDNQRQEL
jgi:sarcosine oxidase subunit alpha